MAEEMDFGPDIISLSDEDGNEQEFEVLDDLDLDGSSYIALVPVLSDEELLEDSGELVVLKVCEENGEEYFEPIQDEAEFNKVSAIFMERLSDEFDFVDDDE